MICAQERRWNELDGITPLEESVHILSRQKETETRGQDDIEEFGYGGAPVRIKSDQEPAIVDVQRAVIAKRGNAPTVPVNSPVGDSQSNGRLENAMVRTMVKTILSSLESKWGVRVTRDHPVYLWVFEWAADLMTRYAQVETWERQQFN